VYISVSLKIAQLYTEKNHTELVRVLRERENNCYVDIGGGYNRLCFLKIFYISLRKYIEGKQALLINGGSIVSFLSCCDIFEYDGRQNIFQVVLILR
jgi:hypothetical protein